MHEGQEGEPALGDWLRSWSFFGMEGVLAWGPRSLEALGDELYLEADGKY